MEIYIKRIMNFKMKINSMNYNKIKIINNFKIIQNLIKKIKISNTVKIMNKALKQMINKIDKPKKMETIHKIWKILFNNNNSKMCNNSKMMMK